MTAEVAWGTYDRRDIRTCYRSELDYLLAMRRRYACQWCGDKAMMCPSCLARDARIADLRSPDHPSTGKTPPEPNSPQADVTNP